MGAAGARDEAERWFRSGPPEEYYAAVADEYARTGDWGAVESSLMLDPRGDARRGGALLMVYESLRAEAVSGDSFEEAAERMTLVVDSAIALDCVWERAARCRQEVELLRQLRSLGDDAVPGDVLESLLGDEPTPLVEHLNKMSKHPLSLSILALHPDQDLKEATLESYCSALLRADQVDERVALTVLLALKRKEAFEAYRTSLPPAMKGEEYAKVSALAKLGLSAAKTWGLKDFEEECVKLSRNARWWATLKRVGVDFSPKKFSDDAKKTKEYATSLLGEFVAKLTEEEPDEALSTASSFCEDFGVSAELAASRQLEHLLSKGSTKAGIEGALRALNGTAARLSSLRRCVIDLKSKDAYGAKYESHVLALEAYFVELGELLRELCQSEAVVRPRYESSEKADETAAKKQDLRDEMALVTRRLDALAILQTFDKSSGQKPNYNRLFTKLPKLGSKPRELKKAGVLLNLERRAGLWDPLNGLRSFLVTDSAATVLAPLAGPLLLPQGYVQARYLQERFLRGDAVSVEAVKGVMMKLPKEDAAVFGEWSAGRYGKPPEKLECLHLAHKLAPSESLQEQVNLLTDEVKVREIIGNDAALLASVFSEPGNVAARLLEKGATSAALKVVRKETTMEDFRASAWRVHSACAAIGEDGREPSDIAFELAGKAIEVGVDYEDKEQGQLQQTTEKETIFEKSDKEACGERDEVAGLVVAFLLSYSRGYFERAGGSSANER